MKRIHVLSTALLVLTVAGPAAMQAQGNRERTQQAQGDPRTHAVQADPRAQRVQPSQSARDPRIERAQPAPAQREQQRVVDERIVRERANEVQDPRRVADYRAQQESALRIEQEQQRLRNERIYANEAASDPRRLYNYRYNVGGVYRETNQYGVDLLRQAVNNGYIEGVRAGQLDRQDRFSPNFQNSRAYRDADMNFNGVNSTYIGQSDYSYYFRQGFQRGYEDGYYSRSMYGSYSNGAGSVLGNILSGILGLETIR